MRIDTSYECLNKKCGTYIFGNGKYMDGLNRPRCRETSFTKVFGKQNSKNIEVIKVESKLFDKEITNKATLSEVMEALDKLDKNYVITKSKREVPSTSYEIPVWQVKEL